MTLEDTLQAKEPELWKISLYHIQLGMKSANNEATNKGGYSHGLSSQSPTGGRARNKRGHVYYPYISIRMAKICLRGVCMCIQVHTCEKNTV